MIFSNRIDHSNMIVGQATLGREVIKQMQEIDVVVLPTTIDGCELTAGIAIVIKAWNLNIEIIVSEHTHN